jgi:Mn2+/Fe2+ NRAMP family transporter
MSKLLEIALGLVTGIGGFLEAGSLATSAQAGAAFGFQLVWAIVLGAICIAFLVEMAGRLAAVSKHTLPDAMRERFGIRFFTVPLVAVVLV